MDEVLEMSSKERDLYRLLNRVAEGKLTQIQAAELSVSQTVRSETELIA